MNNTGCTTRLVLVNLLAATLVACSDSEGNTESAAGAASGSASAPSSSSEGSPAISARGNAAPIIFGAPRATVDAGSLYQFRPSVQDADGDSLTYTVANRPPWAVFDRMSGRLQGIPGTADSGGYDNIRITVSDGKDSAALSPFKITVVDPNAPPVVVSAGGSPSSPDAPGGGTSPDASGGGTPSALNTAPTLTGAPPTSVLPGSQYSFTPNANDSDGDALTFTIVNNPEWASFNPSTGRLQGTPAAQHVGTYANVTIRATDGVATTTLPPFTITVTAVANGSATLSWAAPTQNEDGSPLTNLAGFKVHWGTSRGSYSNSVTIDNPGITTYVVESLVAGTYYFATSAFNGQGVESNFSNEASKTIQ
jgi:hypothetical protein